MPNAATVIVPIERFTSRIHLLRGEKVLFDFDLAGLYGVETRVPVQASKRNADRFPQDFICVLNPQEVASLRSQSVISNKGRGGTRYAPYAFTEQGVAMLSSVLRSPRAMQVSIAILRAVVQLRRTIASHGDLARKLKALERKYDAPFKVVFDAIHALMTKSAAAIEKHGRKIGFGQPACA